MGESMISFKKKGIFRTKYLFLQLEHATYIYQNMLLFFKTTQICTYIPKINKQDRKYPISEYRI